MASKVQSRITARRRSRGERAGLDIPRIIEAARSLDPEAVSMKAVADILGVDRSALNHHVSGRDALLEFVAADAFSAHAATIEIPPTDGWQAACRSFAVGFTDALVATGRYVEFFRPSVGLVPGLLSPAEAVLRALVRAGVDDEVASRCLGALSNICLGFARDVVLSTNAGEHPRARQVRIAVAAHDERFENVSRIASGAYDLCDRKQLEFTVDVFIGGLEDRLFRST